MHKYTFWGCLIFLISSSVNAQNTLLPMDIPPYLSGNFGELRSNHFHSGIDFKTQGRTGIPVRSVDEGYVSRIYVAPSGYGRAAYIDHPDGTTTVYGHLDHFAKKIESAVKDSQYVRQSFTVDLYFPAGTIPVSKGEVIGLSGNTGSSGGPHLHFEIRTTKDENIIDPLSRYKDRIKDSRPPEIRGLMFFPQQGEGVVNNSRQSQAVGFTTTKAGKRVLAKNITAWGNIGVGVKAYDRMTETSNIYGVKEVVLKVDGKVVFHSRMDQFGFDETRYINSMSENNYMKSFVEPGNKLRIYQTTGSGIVCINEERAYAFEYLLSDIYGNQSRLAFTVTGQKQDIPDYRPEGIFFPWNKDNAFSGLGIDLKIPKGNLYNDHYIKIDTIAGNSPYSPLYQIGEKIALHSSCPAVFRITNDSFHDKQKYGVVAVNGNGQSWIGGNYQWGNMHTAIRETGKYTIAIDTVAPTINPLNEQNGTAVSKISFRIKDNLSGIKKWHATLDGHFVLFEYDAKRATLFCTYDPERMHRGRQTLRLSVEDVCGNVATYTDEIRF